MKRFALTLAGLLTLPVLAEAQTRPVYSPEPHPQQLPHSRFSVTPFVGARIPYNTGTFYVTGANGHQLVIDEEREGSPSIGLNADMLLRGPFALTAGFAYSGGVQDIFTFGVPGDSVAEGQILTDAPEMWFVKAGFTARLPDPIRDDRRFHPSAFVTVAPAMVFMGESALRESSRHLALNLGADATARIGRSGWALQLGLEDYITFWNSDEFAERDAALFGTDPRFEDEPVFVDYDYRTANILMARLGVSYRPARGGRPLSTYVAPPAPVERAAAPMPMRLCVVSNGQLTEVEAMYDPQRADTLIGGRPVAMSHPADAPPYASGAPWFIANEPISAGGRRFVKYGLPRTIAASDLRRAGEYQGIPLFAPRNSAGDPEVLFVPIRSGCEFQVYQTEVNTGAVRGE